MAQIFALLYVYPEPLDSDVILETLKISRGNISINLRKLLEWGLVHKIKAAGSRKALYTAERDIWLITANIVRKRFEREIAPIHALLNELIERPDIQADPHTREALSQIQKVISAVTMVTQLALPLLVTAERKRFLKILQAWQKRFSDGNRVQGPSPRGDQ